MWEHVDPIEGSLGSVNIVRLALSIGLLVTVGFGGCGDKGPTGPSESKIYYLYGIDNLNGRRVLRLDPYLGVLDTLADSLPKLNRIDMSADGKLLYVPYTDSLLVYSAITGEHVEALTYPCAQVASSPDGKLLALLGWQHRGLTILGSIHHNLLYSNDSAKVVAGVFTRDSKNLYCIEDILPKRRVMHVRMCDSITLESRLIQSMPGALTQVMPSYDGKLWFLYSTLSYSESSFGVYDAVGDTLIYLMSIVPGGGSIVVSPNGNRVFFTNPGSLLDGPPAPSAFYSYLPEANAVREISTRGFATDSIQGDYLPVGPIAISPDGRFLVVARSLTGTDVLVFDLAEQDMARYYFFDYRASFFSLICQVGK
jgi:DNA-binding beta-propeller fold protein YncE